MKKTKTQRKNKKRRDKDKGIVHVQDVDTVLSKLAVSTYAWRARTSIPYTMLQTRRIENRLYYVMRLHKDEFHSEWTTFQDAMVKQHKTKEDFYRCHFCGKCWMNIAFGIALGSWPKAIRPNNEKGRWSMVSVQLDPSVLGDTKMIHVYPEGNAARTRKFLAIKNDTEFEAAVQSPWVEQLHGKKHRLVIWSEEKQPMEDWLVLDVSASQYGLFESDVKDSPAPIVFRPWGKIPFLKDAIVMRHLGMTEGYLEILEEEREMVNSLIELINIFKRDFGIDVPAIV